MAEVVITGLQPFMGAWVNTLETTAWIREFTIAVDGGAPFIEVVGARPPERWGRALLDSFCFKPGEHAFAASFELPGSTCDLVAYSNLGLVVIAAYFDFDDPAVGGHLCREFYVPRGGS